MKIANPSRLTLREREHAVARLIGRKLGLTQPTRRVPDDGDDAALPTAYGQHERNYYSQLDDPIAEPARMGR